LGTNETLKRGHKIWRYHIYGYSQKIPLQKEWSWLWDQVPYCLVSQLSYCIWGKDMVYDKLRTCKISSHNGRNIPKASLVIPETWYPVGLKKMILRAP